MPGVGTHEAPFVNVKLPTSITHSFIEEIRHQRVTLNSSLMIVDPPIPLKDNQRKTNRNQKGQLDLNHPNPNLERTVNKIRWHRIRQ